MTGEEAHDRRFALLGRGRLAARLAKALSFSHLQTKLTVLYSILLVLILAAILAAVSLTITRNAERIVREELTASGTVFGRIWTMRAEELQSGADVLSRDFGFRAAVATRDTATIGSALGNLKARFKIDSAFVVGPDGALLASDSETAIRPTDEVLAAIVEQDSAAGIFVVDGVPYQGVAAPIMTPGLAGWVVFAIRLDSHEMASLVSLSAIPLEPLILSRTSDGRFGAGANLASAAERALVGKVLDRAHAREGGGRDQAATRIGPAIVVVRPLPSMTNDGVALLLRYPLARALAPYQPILAALLVVGLAALGIIAAGSWALALNVTRPLHALRNAAALLERGEEAEVETVGTDEIASLQRSFNSMARGIRERERALDASRLDAEAASRAKSEFLANMSHEIRTPLNGILGMAQVLARNPANESQRDGLSVIKSSGEALLAVLNAVLDISKIEAGRLELNRHDFDLEEIIRGCRVFESLAVEKDLGFRLDVAPEALGRWHGDSLRLGQVLSNLISNAVKFTADGRVTIAIRATQDGLGFRISDTGCGIPADRLEDIFDKFSQLDASTTRSFGGTGLGLAISRELVTLMGGVLWVSSLEGRGSQFWFDLPLQRGSDAGASPAPDAVSADVERPIRILAAEDNRTNQLILAALLEPAGVDLTIVENGRAAVEAYANNQFDVVLMDIQMPELNGLDATLAIRNLDRHAGRHGAPIIALSANVMAHQIAEYLAAGMDGVVAKPIEAAVLFNCIDEAMAKAAQAAAPASAAMSA